MRGRLSKKKLILVGHSWGAILGLHVVKRWPALFHAFVGTGLPVSWKLVVESQGRWAREQATAAGDQQTLKTLDAAASLPENHMRRSGHFACFTSAPEFVAALRQAVGPLVT